jgi:Fur family ferric uptake transcriptional regulator
MTPQSPEPNLTGQPRLLRSILNQEGRRLTNQRQKILALFENPASSKHLSAEEIRQQLIDQGDTISFSTIYRTLHVMVEMGLIKEVGLADGRKYYELSNPLSKEHHHLVCVQCGAVQEFDDNQVIVAAQKETETRGFSLSNCQFTVFGICPQCQSMAN